MDKKTKVLLGGSILVGVLYLSFPGAIGAPLFRGLFTTIHLFFAVFAGVVGAQGLMSKDFNKFLLAAVILILNSFVFSSLFFE